MNQRRLVLRVLRRVFSAHLSNTDDVKFTREDDKKKTKERQSGLRGCAVKIEKD